MFTLRPDQQTCVDQLRAALKAGDRRVLLQAPCGFGKTVLMAHLLRLAVQNGARAWFLVHRRELLDQSVRVFYEAAGLYAGSILADVPESPGAAIQVCGVQTLVKRLHRLQPPDLLVFDEAHHVAAGTWEKVVAHCPQAVHLGLTATPQRLDGRGLRPYFDTLIAGPSVRALIDAGHLAPFQYFAPSTVSLHGVHVVAGDYNKHEVAQRMQQSTVFGDALTQYRKLAPGTRALVFAWSVAASKQLAADFVAAGIPAAHLDGESSDVERAFIMRRFREGAIRVLCNIELFAEGLDVPAVDAVFLLRPTASLGLHLQQLGRGLRTAPGKSVVRIFDHVANYSRHGLPDAEHVWTLDQDRAKKKPAEKSLRLCLKCLAVSAAGAVRCSVCGAAFPVKPRKVTRVSSEMAQVDGVVAKPESPIKVYTLKEWQEIARQKGYRPGWAWHRLQEQRDHLRSLRAHTPTARVSTSDGEPF